MGKVRRARSPSSTASSAWSTASSAASASSAWARGVLAFHSSHTDGAKSSGVSRPARMSSTRRRMMTAPDPRCDSTWAIDHSVS